MESGSKIHTIIQSIINIVDICTSCKLWSVSGLRVRSLAALTPNPNHPAYERLYCLPCL